MASIQNRQKTFFAMRPTSPSLGFGAVMESMDLDFILMTQFPFKLRRTFLVAIAIGLVWLIQQARTPAQVSSRLESRVTQLEFQIRNLNAQLNQLSSQLSGINLGATGHFPPLPQTTPGTGDPSLEAQFDNLATLAIETKQDVQALEQRVAALEARL